MNPETSKSPTAKKEEEILKFWQENKIFEKTLQKKSPKGEFVFYEGPPTANGRPGIHHLEARAFKDAIPRYKTMQGFHVGRKAGWDTHGLPVELQVEKELGLQSKKEIEKYGVASFNKKCKESVLRYIEEWRNFTDRIGFWVDKENAYFTFNSSYIESVWGIVKKIDDQKLLYKDYKVVPWCPRCGTALSSHELAQGYQQDKDLAVFAKFEIKGLPFEGKAKSQKLKAKSYFIVWTTTPWTLPGNVALAVGENIKYVKWEIKSGEHAGETYIMAESRQEEVFKNSNIFPPEADFKNSAEQSFVLGKELVGLEYEPLYPFLKDDLSGSEKSKLPKAFRVYTAPFVTTEDGTGIVHIAPMYGADDFELGTKEGLPKHHLVKEDGTFVDYAGFLANRFVKNEDVAVDIIKDLAGRGLLFKKEKFEHSYPHCWRCKTPLIYFARDSWYIKVSALKDKLVSENEKINWEPSYIKEGRFGEWLREIKDWAISRERYWGTPLPVWISKDGKERFIPKDIADLKNHTKKSGNKYFLMRHGEAEHNVLDITTTDHEKIYHLTEKGRDEVEKSAKKLKKEKIDLIIYSPLTRTKETAEIIKKVLGNIESKEDKRIGEEDFGKISGTKSKDVAKYFPSFAFRLDTSVEGCETLRNVKKRIGDFIYDIDKIYSDKKILIVTHDGPARLFLAVAEGADDNRVQEIYRGEAKEHDLLSVGDYIPFEFIPISHNDDYVLDLHKPYIDEIELVSKNGEPMTRVKEVMDVWFDSGAMPFAQDAELRGNDAEERRVKSFRLAKKGDELQYPADFISEAIDQTRGWFYTLHAVGCMMGRGAAYKNVICLGHLNDKDGKKMSKSIGNIVDPWLMIEKYGVDALRLWMYSVNQPGEPKNFDEKTVDEIVKKNFNLLSNVNSFYELYRDKNIEEAPFKGSKDILDRWILMRLSELIALVTENLDNYKLLEPVRALREFIDDLSTWYLRRSRDRIRDGSSEAKQTLYYVLKTISKLLAPFAPFYAESLYKNLKTSSDKESVHLEEWPEIKDSGLKINDSGVIENMIEVRKICSLGLNLRSGAKINVRQPLSKLKVVSGKLKGRTEYVELIKDEVNVREVFFEENLQNEVELDTSITPELKEAGMVREIIRALQDVRKKKGLSPKDIVVFQVVPNADARIVFDNQKNFLEIKKAVLAKEIEIVSDMESGDEIVIEDIFIKVSIRS